jgi:hypothetical protein
MLTDGPVKTIVATVDQAVKLVGVSLLPIMGISLSILIPFQMKRAPGIDPHVSKPYPCSKARRFQRKVAKSQGRKADLACKTGSPNGERP